MLAKLLGALLVLAFVAGSRPAYAEPPPIFVGGQFIRQHAIEDERGHLLVPVRGVFEAFGARVAYTPPRIVVVRKDGAVIAGLVVGRKSAIVANRPRLLGAAPVRKGNRVYVPLRSIAEIAGATVHYSTKPRLVDIRVPYNQLAVSGPAREMALVLPDESLPPWACGLVGAIVLCFLLESGRRVAAVMPRRSPGSAVRGNPSPSVIRALQLPYAGDAGDQNRIGKMRK